jgi:hypothetical protein
MTSAQWRNQINKLFVAAFLSMCAVATMAASQVIRFDQYHFGAVPSEFDYDSTGHDEPAVSNTRPFWRIYVDLFAPSSKFVLIQASGLAQSDAYPIALLHGFKTDEVRLGVFLKLLGGDIDRSAGLLWRARDRNNYYAALVDARNSQLRVLAIESGRPVALASAPIHINVGFEQREPTDGWYKLEVSALGDRHVFWFQGQKLLEVQDGTFRQAGQVGLITHADTIATFDDFCVDPSGATLLAPCSASLHP